MHLEAHFPYRRGHGPVMAYWSCGVRYEYEHRIIVGSRRVPLYAAPYKYVDCDRDPDCHVWIQMIKRERDPKSVFANTRLAHLGVHLIINPSRTPESLAGLDLLPS